MRAGNDAGDLALIRCAVSSDKGFLLLGFVWIRRRGRPAQSPLDAEAQGVYSVSFVLVAVAAGAAQTARKQSRGDNNKTMHVFF